MVELVGRSADGQRRSCWIRGPLDGSSRRVAGHRLQPQQRFLLAELPAFTFAALKQLALAPLARLVLVSMQFLRGQDADSAMTIMHGVVEVVRRVWQEPGGRERLLQVWYYLFLVSDLDLQAAQELIAAEVDARIGHDMKTTAERLEEKGYQRGMAEATARTRAATLLRLIERRFGPAADAVRARVQQASATDLERWLDAIFDAPTVDALLAS